MKKNCINTDGKHLDDYKINPTVYFLTAAAVEILKNADEDPLERIDILVSNVKMQIEGWEKEDTVDYSKRSAICYLKDWFIRHFKQEISINAVSTQQFLIVAIDMIDWYAVIAYTGIFDSIKKFKGTTWKEKWHNANNRNSSDDL